jgi:hypothetical protein
MTKHVLVLAITTTLLGTTAFAQAVNFSEIDQNGDGILQQEELVNAFGQTGAATILALDGDGDGTVSWVEANAASRQSANDSADGGPSGRGLEASVAGGENRSARGSEASTLRGENRSERSQSASDALGNRADASENRSDRSGEARSTGGDRGREASEAKGGNGRGRNGN